MRRKFTIVVDQVVPIDEEIFLNYILDAVDSWRGQFHPSDERNPFKLLKVSSGKMVLENDDPTIFGDFEECST